MLFLAETITIILQLCTYGILYVLSLIGGEVLTGSWRPENQLEIWDYGSGKRVTGE